MAYIFRSIGFQVEGDFDKYSDDVCLKFWRTVLACTFELVLVVIWQKNNLNLIN